MSIVVEHEGELYSLLIDQVGEVLHVSDSQFVQDTTSLSDSWRDIAQGIFRLEERLLVLLDVSSILAFDR
jgi:purine-binding chemotaxis protein CheW